jgi:hypothetical protein
MAENEKKDQNQPSEKPTSKEKPYQSENKATGSGAPGDQVSPTMAPARRVEQGPPFGDPPAIQHVVVDEIPPITLENAAPIRVEDDPAAAYNAIILSATEAMRFGNYFDFIERVFCTESDIKQSNDPCASSENSATRALRDAAKSPVDVFRGFSPRYAYDLLKAATEAYVALQCACYSAADGRLDYYGPVLEVENTPEEIRDVLLNDFLVGKQILPYIDTVVRAYIDVRQATTKPVSLCAVSPLRRFQPCAIELIWSYWHEEGMLVQAMNAISLRFQNKRAGNGRDPLAHFELTPLRPLNNLLWGYVQDEQNRLTVARRADEYLHEYGLPLFGKAVSTLNPADVRSKFIEAFHSLLHTASVYYRDQSNRFVVPDAFPLLNALKEVHLILAEGAHNQFFDLTFTARVEMLIQKWLLSRPEMERFLAGRFMVPYPETWMGVVDTMKTLQGWTDVSVRHFRDLAVAGEQLLLSIRWNNWSDNSSSAFGLTTRSAANWATIWRDAIQGYIHSYRAATGVDLAASTSTIRLAAESYTQPSVLLRNRLAAQRRP